MSRQSFLRAAQYLASSKYAVGVESHGGFNKKCSKGRVPVCRRKLSTIAFLCRQDLFGRRSSLVLEVSSLGTATKHPKS